MSTPENIRYLKRGQIDVDKWNECIDAAPNGLVYANSWYLDAMCDNWDALVLADYQTVMPIPWRRKWGIKYVYTPAFVQQLGIIGPQTTTLQAQFCTQLFSAIKYGSYNFNFCNPELGLSRTNFVLNLVSSYHDLFTHFADDLKKNLKKAQRYGLEYGPSSNYKLNVQMYRQYYGSRISSVRSIDFLHFEKMCEKLGKKNQLVARETRDDKGNLVASALLLHYKNRLYLLMCTTTEMGRKMAAAHFLLDRLILEFSGNDVLLDFEGSDLPGVYHFYKNFNPDIQPYYLYQWNHLPFPLRWLKK